MRKTDFRVLMTDAAPINLNCRTSNLSKGYHQSENRSHPCNELTTFGFGKTRRVLPSTVCPFSDIAGNDDHFTNKKNKERPCSGCSLF
jgi:hypothetical protein